MYKINQIYNIPIYIGTFLKSSCIKSCRCIAVYDKGHLGKMYLFERPKTKIRTCITVPPAFKFNKETLAQLPVYREGTHYGK